METEDHKNQRNLKFQRHTQKKEGRKKGTVLATPFSVGGKPKKPMKQRNLRDPWDPRNQRDPRKPRKPKKLKKRREKRDSTCNTIFCKGGGGTRPPSPLSFLWQNFSKGGGGGG